MQFSIPNLFPEKKPEKCFGHCNNQDWNVTATTRLGIGLWGTIIIATIILWSWEVRKNWRSRIEMETKCGRGWICNKKSVGKQKKWLWELAFGIWSLGSVKSWSEVYQLGNFGVRRAESLRSHSIPKFVTLISAFRFALVCVCQVHDSKIFRLERHKASTFQPQPLSLRTERVKFISSPLLWGE